MKKKIKKKIEPASGVKFDQHKPRMDLLPSIPMEGLSVVLGFGAAKYGDSNWVEGMNWRRIIGSLLRHTFAFSKGEDFDPESGLPHVDHILANATFLSQYFRTKREFDNRIKNK